MEYLTEVSFELYDKNTIDDQKKRMEAGNQIGWVPKLARA